MIFARTGTGLRVLVWPGSGIARRTLQRPLPTPGRRVRRPCSGAAEAATRMAARFRRLPSGCRREARARRTQMFFAPLPCRGRSVRRGLLIQSKPSSLLLRARVTRPLGRTDILVHPHIFTAVVVDDAAGASDDSSPLSAARASGAKAPSWNPL